MHTRTTRSTVWAKVVGGGAGGNYTGNGSLLTQTQPGPPGRNARVGSDKDHAVADRASLGVAGNGLADPNEEVEFDFASEAPRPPDAHVAYQEKRAPETFFPWGENAGNGSWITPFPDHAHFRARVCGGNLGGSPGRFKALYRVRWARTP